jgi:hypothetical protein
MSTKKILTTLIIAAIPLQSSAGFVDGNELSRLLGAHSRMIENRGIPGDAQDASTLMGYIMGTHDTLENVSFCTPPNSTVGQLAAVVKKYVNDNPDKWTLPGKILVRWALTDAFPCKK